MIRLFTTLKNSRAAIDLASVIVGIIVIGIIGGVLAAVTFAVIPWAHDHSAKSQLEAVNTAENAYTGLHNGTFTASLGSLLNTAKSNVQIRSDENTCYLAFTRSESGNYFYVSNLQPAAQKVALPWPAQAPSGIPAGCAWPTSADNFTTAGTTTVTNLDPETLGADWDTNRWFGGGTSAGIYSVIDTSGTTPWANAARKTWTVASAQQGDTGFDSSSYIPVTAGKTYTASGWLRSSVPQNGNEVFYWYDKDGNPVSRDNGPAINLRTDKWTQVFDTETAPAGAASVIIVSDVLYNTTVNQWQPKDTLDGTAAMLTEGTTVYSFANGDTAGWSWNGVAGKSSSTGKAVF